MNQSEKNQNSRKRPSLFNSWEKNNIDEFSKAVLNFKRYHLKPAINFIENKFDLITKKDKFNFLKVLYSWVISLKNKSDEEERITLSLEQKIFCGKYSIEQIKSKNNHYLEICALFSKSSSNYHLSETLLKYNWNEGWSLFTKSILQNNTNSLEYIKNTFLHMNENSIDQVKTTLGHEVISKYLNLIQSKRPNLYWISSMAKDLALTDEKKILLLNFSDEYTKGIEKFNMESLIPLINKNSPDTVAYLIKKLSPSFIKEEVYPYFEDLISKNKYSKMEKEKESLSFLKYCMIDYQLIKKETKPKEVKIKI